MHDIGVPRNNALYKFERMNHILKQLLQNSAKGLPSIIKNYLEHENVSIHIALSIHNVKKMDQLSMYKPNNSVSKDIDHTLRGVFVDNESEGGNPIIYDIENAGIMELNGQSTSFDMSVSNFSWLILTAALQVVDKTSLMYILLRKYTKSPIRSADFVNYISHILCNEQSVERLTRTRKTDTTFMSDIESLSATVRRVLADNRFIIRYDIVTIALYCFILHHIYTPVNIAHILLNIASYIHPCENCHILYHIALYIHSCEYCHIYCLILSLIHI